MHDDPPIEIQVNTARLLMDRIHGVLEFQLRNRADGESFEIEVRVHGRAVPDGQFGWHGRLAAGQLVAHVVQVHLKAEGEGGSSAGDAKFEIVLEVSAPGERHRYEGQFVLPVLAYAETLQQVTVNVNIGKVIEQSDKGGMGSINEVEVRDLVNLPESTDVNTWLRQERVPIWSAVRLYYRGLVEGEARAKLHRRPGARRRTSSLHRVGSDGALLITSLDKVRFGRRRDCVDIATWVLPRGPESHGHTQSISSVHATLTLTDRGLQIRAESETVRKNPHLLQVDGTNVPWGISLIPTYRPSTFRFGSGFDLKVEPLEAPLLEAGWKKWISSPDNHHAEMWRRSEASKLGGVLLERTDGWAQRERYLWLLSAVKISDLRLGGGQSRSRLLLAAMPHLVLVHLGDAPPVRVGDRTIGSFEAAPLAPGDRCECEEWAIEVGEFEQRFE